MAGPYVPGYATHPLQSTNAKAKTLLEGYRAAWFYEHDIADTVCDKLFESRKSNRRSEVEFAMIGLGLAQSSGEGQETPFESITDNSSKETQWITYKLGYMVTREAIDDDRYNIHRTASKKLPRAFKYRKEANCAGTLGGVFSTTLGFDPVTTTGVAVASTSHNFASGKSHLVSGATTWSNRLATDSALSWETLKTAQILMANTPSDEGFPLNLTGNTLVIPVDISDVAWEICNSSKRPDSDENTSNILSKGNPWNVDVVVWKWLPTTTEWHLIDKSELNAFWYNRNKPEFHDDTDWNKGILRFYGYSRGNSDINEPRGIVSTPGA